MSPTSINDYNVCSRYKLKHVDLANSQTVKGKNFNITVLPLTHSILCIERHDYTGVQFLLDTVYYLCILGHINIDIVGWRAEIMKFTKLMSSLKFSKHPHLETHSNNNLEQSLSPNSYYWGQLDYSPITKLSPFISETINTKMYILTFNISTTPILKIGYTITKVEIYIPNTKKLKCPPPPKKTICRKCRENNLEHMEINCDRN